MDGDHHTNRYDYTNSLITQVTDPLGQTHPADLVARHRHRAGLSAQRAAER